MHPCRLYRHSFLPQQKILQGPSISRKPWNRISPGAYPSDAFAEYSQFRLHPLWHESEKLNRLRERVSGQDNHPIHE